MICIDSSKRRFRRAFYRLCGTGSIALAFAVLLSNPAAAEEQHQFVGHKRCKTCHKKEAIGNQYEIWLDSRHAKAYETLAGEKAREWGAKVGVDNPQTNDKCIKCHSTAHGIPDAMVSKNFDRTAGVQCEACHGAGSDYRKKRIMADPAQAIAQGLVPQNEAVCTRCHNDESPAWDPQRYTLSDGSKVGFDYDQATKRIAHTVPEEYDPKAEGEAD
jgi:YD repeat-containing protein